MWSSGKYSSPTIVPPLAVDDLADARVQHVRPDVVGRRQVERLRAGLSHQPRDERVDLLRRHRAGAEDERVGLLPLVLLGVDVERLALDDGRALDGLPRRAVDAAEDDVDAVLLDQLRRRWPRRRRRRSRCPRGTARACRPSRPPLALMSPMTIRATLALASPDERERAGLVRDDSHLDGVAAGVGDAVMLSSLTMSAPAA